MDKIDKIMRRQEGIIDCHTHAGLSIYSFYQGLYPAMQSLEDLVKKTDSTKVDWIICFPHSDFYFCTREMLEENQPIPSGLGKFPFEIANRYFLMEVELCGQKVLPFVVFHPTLLAKKQCEEIKNWHERHHIFGLKLLTRNTGCSIRDVIGTPFVDLLRASKWPLVVHSGHDSQSNPLNVFEFAEIYPDIKICVAHCGRFIKEFWSRIYQYGNIFVDVSPFLLSCLDAQKIQREKGHLLELDYTDPHKVIAKLHEYLPSRLLWGTDEPWTKVSRISYSGKLDGGFSYEEEKKFLDSIDLELRKTIAWQNPKYFLSAI